MRRKFALQSDYFSFHFICLMTYLWKPWLVDWVLSVLHYQSCPSIWRIRPFFVFYFSILSDHFVFKIFSRLKFCLLGRILIECRRGKTKTRNKIERKRRATWWWTNFPKPTRPRGKIRRSGFLISKISNFWL